MNNFSFKFLVLIFNLKDVVVNKVLEFQTKTIEDAYSAINRFRWGVQEVAETTGFLSVPLNSANFFDAQLRELELSVSLVFDRLIRLKTTCNSDLFQFLTPEQAANWRDHLEDMIQVSWRNDITGNTMDFAIQCISDEGIFGYITDPDFDKDAYRQIKFSDLSGIDDRIAVIQEMERNVEKSIQS